jgi:hypothetical protein
MDEETPKRGRGRPRTTGTTPKRNIRVGQTWDDAEKIAKASGETMTALVTRLLENYVRQHKGEIQI